MGSQATSRRNARTPDRLLSRGACRSSKACSQLASAGNSHTNSQVGNERYRARQVSARENEQRPWTRESCAITLWRAFSLSGVWYSTLLGDALDARCRANRSPHPKGNVNRLPQTWPPKLNDQLSLAQVHSCATVCTVGGTRATCRSRVEQLVPVTACSRLHRARCAGSRQGREWSRSHALGNYFDTTIAQAIARVRSESSEA